MMDKYFKVSNMLFFSLIATLSTFKKKKKKIVFITKHLTDFAMLYVSSLVLIKAVARYTVPYL